MLKLADDFLRGSYTPVVTPFRGGAVDYETYAALIERQAAQGSQGVVVAGTTGEPTTLSIDERKQLLMVALDAAGGRMPIVAATGSQSHADTVQLTAHAEKAGAAAVLILTPYFIRPPQRGLVEYYADLASRTALPMLIYHIPGRAAVAAACDTIEKIAARAPNLVGIKQAVNDLTLVSELIARLGSEFRIFVGLEELSFPMMAIGACGVMNAVGNIAPRRVAELCELVRSGNLSDARAAHFALFELNQAIFFDTNPIPLKYMMKRLDLLPVNEHRLPMVPAAPELERRLDEVLKRAGLL
ncbi:MAG: 4-hydroxy-tetrahydrodipicolinate synthase [Candidatus Binataceae bacterium]